MAEDIDLNKIFEMLDEYTSCKLQSLSIEQLNLIVRNMGSNVPTELEQQLIDLRNEMIHTYKRVVFRSSTEV